MCSGGYRTSPIAVNGTPAGAPPEATKRGARRLILALGAALALLAPPAAAQEADAAPLPVATCGEKRGLHAVAQALGVNLVANRVNVWVFDWDWAKVGFESWAENLELGWQWDKTQFGTNMFLHPYHGSLYFDAGRANCLSFWESVPLTFLGSWTWEYFGERKRPALNDFWMTGFGGVAIGEIAHRVSSAILNERSVGGERLVREIGALVVNPMRGVNRLVRGQWNDVRANPPDRLPQAYLFRGSLGGRTIRENGPDERPTRSPTLLIDVALGDVFDRGPRSPFDVITFQAQISPDGGGVNLLRATGRLWGRELTPAESWHRHALFVNQRFDYVNNPAYRFGEQSVETGVESRWRTGPRGLRVESRVAADVVMLGAIDAWDPDRALHEYQDFGPGVGAIAEIALERNGTRYISWYNRVRYLRTVSGVPADHTIFFSGLDVTVPITEGIGVGAHFSGDRRKSYFKHLADVERSYTETRVYLSWIPDRRLPGSGR
ncbi:MAG: DUF3943 domain-containing protein [Gemmatimonadales bacterium]